MDELITALIATGASAVSAGCVIPGENTAPGRVTNSTKYEEYITAQVKQADIAYITII